MRILSFGNDTNLLLEEDPTNEGQYRQRRYCECLGQSKTFIIRGTLQGAHDRVLADGRVKAYGVGRNVTSLLRAFAIGVHIGRQIRPHVVEYQDPRVAGLIAYAVARTLDIPLIGGVFNDLLDNPVSRGSSPVQRLLNKTSRWVLLRSRAVRCDSQATTAALNHKGFANVRYIPFFVPWIERFAATAAVIEARAAQWETNPIILCSARLVADKNISLLLRALAQLSRGRLIVTGAGPLRDDLTRQAAELGIEDRVTWAGYVDSETLFHHFHVANVFVLPSNTETSARVLIQAQAARLPTVTTATSGSQAVVRDGHSGYVTPVGDERALARALDKLLTDRALYHKVLNSPGYYEYTPHTENGVMPPLREFYADALRSA